jgi:predicted phage tail protein
MSKYDKKKVSAMVNNNERLFRPTQIVQERVYSNTLNRNGSVFRIIQDDRVVEVIVKLNTPKLCSYNEYGDESTARIPLTILLNDEEVIKDEWDGHVRSYSKSYTIKRKEPGIMRITVRRDSPDNDDSRVQDSLFWESYTEVVNSNGSDTNIVSVEIATCDSDNGWNGTSILFECNHNSEDLEKHEPIP